MSRKLLDGAIRSVFNCEQAFCKFLSANDAGATGAHQAGILISLKASSMLFRENLQNENILKRVVKIKWNNDFSTDSCFTYYSSKKELRITQFGKGFPFLKPENTGALFVLTKESDDDYNGYFLEREQEIDEFLNTFNISPTDTNNIIDTLEAPAEVREKSIIQEYISNFRVEFPASEVMSYVARHVHRRIYGHADYSVSNPDNVIIEWTNMEYKLFRYLEHERYNDVITKGFKSVDEFVSMANMVLNRRKSRAGKSLEHHLAAIFDDNQIVYTSQAVTEGKKRPDFIFPSEEDYHNMSFPVDKLASLAAKTTCKDRWRQVINEADRLRDKPKYLCTLQQGISPTQMDEMQAANVVLVVPKPYISSYPKDKRDRLWTIAKFVNYIREIENN